jgi:hypothetical protein
MTKTTEPLTGRRLVFIHLAAARACLSQKKVYPVDKQWARHHIARARAFRALPPDKQYFA